MVDIFLFPPEPEPEDIRLGDPTQAGGGGITITPAAASCRALASSPDVALGAVEISPLAVVARSLAINPAVAVPEGIGPVGGGGVGPVRQVRPVRLRTARPSVRITPRPVSASARNVAPEIVLGSVVLEPIQAMAGAVAWAPGVRLGDLHIAPDPARGLAGVSGPDIQVKGDAWDDAIMDELLAIYA